MILKERSKYNEWILCGFRTEYSDVQLSNVFLPGKLYDWVRRLGLLCFILHILIEMFYQRKICHMPGGNHAGIFLLFKPKCGLQRILYIEKEINIKFHKSKIQKEKRT